MFVAFLYELRRPRGAGGRAGGARAGRRARARAARQLARRLLRRGARALRASRAGTSTRSTRPSRTTSRACADEALALTEELLEWLERARGRARADARGAGSCSSARPGGGCASACEQRLAEQRERHDGGNRWIGTGGHVAVRQSAGYAPERASAWASAGRPAARWQIADERRFTRPTATTSCSTPASIEVALRRAARVRARGRARRAGPRRDHRQDRAERRRAGDRAARRRAGRTCACCSCSTWAARWIRTPTSASGCSRAAQRATHFKELRTYYFHNCVYGRVYETAALTHRAAASGNPATRVRSSSSAVGTHGRCSPSPTR